MNIRIFRRTAALALAAAGLLTIGAGALFGKDKEPSQPPEGAPVAKALEITTYRGVPYRAQLLSTDVEGDAVTKGDTFCDVESVKAVSDVMSPVTGVVAAVNEELLDAPEKLNEAPYEAWIAKIGEITDQEELMDAAAYEAFIAQQ